MADGAGAGAEGQAPQPGEQEQTPAPNPAQMPQQKAQQQPAQHGEEGENWPEEARKALKYARDEAAKSRIKAREADDVRKALLGDLMKVLDPNAGEQEQTPEALLSRVKDVEAERDTSAVRAALILEAWKAGVDLDRLDFLEYKVTRRDDFKGLDLATAEWGDTLRTMVTDEVAKDGTLKASGAHQGTGDGQYGGSGAQPTLTKADFLSMSLQDKTALYRNNRAEYDRLASA